MAAKVPCCHPESVPWTKGPGISSVKCWDSRSLRSGQAFAEFILREMKRILRCAPLRFQDADGVHRTPAIGDDKRGPQDDSAGAQPPVFTSKLATRRWIGATRRRQRAPMSTYLAYLVPSALPESTETSPNSSLFDPPASGRIAD